MRQRPIIAKTFYVAVKYLKLWREHNMVSDFEVTYSCYVFLVVCLTYRGWSLCLRLLLTLGSITNPPPPKTGTFVYFPKF